MAMKKKTKPKATAATVLTKDWKTAPPITAAERQAERERVLAATPAGKGPRPKDVKP